MITADETLSFLPLPYMKSDLRARNYFATLLLIRKYQENGQIQNVSADL
jgi:hypothetical protein